MYQLPGGSVPATSGPVPPSQASVRSPAGLFPRLVFFLRRHPILCLFLLTPGLVEYLSGSSSFVYLVFSPAWFFLALGINAAMYTSGALLIREALIRWKKGWPTVFALGGAYALMEEGIADQTIFNPHTSPIGAAGVYGHFAGVNWLFFPDIFVIHILMSLLIPILLLGYALPETRGKSLLTNQQIKLVVGIIAVDTAFLTVLVVGKTGYWYGFPLLGVSIVAIVALCLLGWWLPRDFLLRRRGPPASSRLAFFLVGCLAFPIMVVLATAGAARGLPPALVFMAIVGMTGAFFVWVLRRVGTEHHERHVVAFGAGLLVLGLILGVLFEFPWEFVLIADAAVVYFLYWLDQDLARRYAQVRSSVGIARSTPA
ncbi:MAG: hypothetical protein L3K14_06220 [Thermoplasmata archaeon]|nr:hypothetical protein [Thermoplasmata archaeon]